MACTTASLAIAFAACGGATPASKLATLPEFDAKGQAKCGVKQSQSEPLIVEWPSAARGKLESIVESKKIVAVHYSGCEMQVLARCAVPGKYVYRPFRNKKDDEVVMQTADDLYANMPVGAAALEARLSTGGALRVDMKLVGRYEADVTGVGKDDMKGECDGATHVVSALTVGAFDFYQAGRAQVGGGVKAGGIGAGGESRADRSSIRADGSVAACAKATIDDADPPADCGALIRVEVVPLSVDADTPDPRLSLLDPVFYLRSYPELKASLGNDMKAARNHWLAAGIKECRQSSATFSVKDYLERYPELKKLYGVDCAAALEHWLSRGKKEGRDASPASVAPSTPAASAAPDPTPAPAASAPAPTSAPATTPATGPVRADARIVYGASPERRLNNCRFCDATYWGNPSGALLRFQQGTGYTVWSINMPTTITRGANPVGKDLRVYVAESDPALPARVRGSYNSVSGTITFTSIDYRHGGHVDGVIDIVLEGGNDSPKIRATMKATFHAEFPN